MIIELDDRPYEVIKVVKVYDKDNEEYQRGLRTVDVDHTDEARIANILGHSHELWYRDDTQTLEALCRAPDDLAHIVTLKSFDAPGDPLLFEGSVVRDLDSLTSAMRNSHVKIQVCHCCPLLGVIEGQHS